MANEIYLHNTKSRKDELFTPLKKDLVSIYSCGPTVYHYAHIGNLRAYVFADILRRMFVEAGYTVNHIINITDVGHMVGDGDDGQDKLEKGAAREGTNVWEVAKKYTDAFFDDLTALNIPKDTYIFPRATDHIREQIGLISALEIAGHTYTISDGVYFDTSTFPHYADFAHLDIEGLQSGARVEENTEKRNITDFALWKFSPKDEQRQMEWDSPWGKGFPGWHIECSAMSMKYLGESFDIHTGGIDHIPVHHTNEIAQSECVTGKTYANYWMHVNFLNDKAGKMSKSNDDFLTISSLVRQGYDPFAYRYYLLTTHYRKEIAFSYEALSAASTAYRRLEIFCIEYKNSLSTHMSSGTILSQWKADFDKEVRDDLSTPSAIAVLWKMFQDEGIMSNDKYETLMYMSNALGLGVERTSNVTLVIPEIVQKLRRERDTAKASKNYKESDSLRDQISSLGFEIKDTENGSILSKKTT